MDFAGCELNRNRLIALMSAIVLEEVSVDSHSCHSVCYIGPESELSSPFISYSSIQEQLLSRTV